MAGSAWGDSWGDAWGDSWGGSITPVVTTTEVPGGHRIKDQDSDHRRKPKDEYEPVKTRDLTDDEREALDQGFRERAGVVAVIPDAVPVYVAPQDPIGSGVVVRKAVRPTPSVPSVVGAVFDATATQDQRENAFDAFDRLDRVLERTAHHRRLTARAQHDASLRYAADLAQRQQAERAAHATAREAEQERQRQADETEMVALLLALHEDL